MKSWKTTAAGILAVVSAAISLIAQPLLDGNDATSANWTGFLPILMGGVGLLFSRDNDKSSETVGAK